MADPNRRKSRKSKLVPRQFEDELQTQPTPSAQVLPIQFDIKVEIESCDEDFDITNQFTNTEVKIEKNEEIDLFEAEQEDINQLALSLAKSTKSKDVNNEESGEEQKLNVSASVAETKEGPNLKRKRVPNIKKEYDYSLNDYEEHTETDVNTLANFLGSAKKQKTSKPDKVDSLLINKKIELWKLLNVEEDDSVTVKEEVYENEEETSDFQDTNASIDVIDVSEDVSKTKKKKSKSKAPAKPSVPPLRQIKIEDETVLEELDKLSDKITDEVDKILAIEMRNSWGRVRNVCHIETELQKKLQTALETWRSWTKVPRNCKDAPLMYKCYVCEQAWWHFSSFKEHLDTHNEPDLNVEIEMAVTECSIVCSFIHSVPKFFPIADNCWRCDKDLAFHEDALCSKKIARYIYYCLNCKGSFTSCRILWEHENVCPKILDKLYATTDISDLQAAACTICDFKSLNQKVLENHLENFHSVRSDLPVLGVIRHCTICSQSISVHNFHICPKRNQNFECEHCCRKFPSGMAYEMHLIDNEDNTSCRICSDVLPKRCMEARHMVSHSALFASLLKCRVCENVLVYDQQSAKQHTTIWHKQKFDKRRNHFEWVIVPKALVERIRMEKLEVVTSVRDVQYSGSEQDGLQLLNIKMNRVKLQKALASANIRRNKRGDKIPNLQEESNHQEESSNQEESTNQEDDDISLQKEDDIINETVSRREDSDNETEDAVFEVTKQMNRSEEESDQEGYELMLNKVFHTKPQSTFEVQLLEEETPIETYTDVPSCLKDVTMKTMYQCTMCSYKGSLAMMKTHMDVKHKNKKNNKKKDETFKCTKCDVTFNSLREYCMHLGKHGYEPKTCPECMSTFANYTFLEKHIRARAKVLVVKMQFFVRKESGDGAQLLIKHQCRKCKKEVTDIFAHWESHLGSQELPEDPPFMRIKQEPEDEIEIKQEPVDGSYDEGSNQATGSTSVNESDVFKEHFMEWMLNNSGDEGEGPAAEGGAAGPLAPEVMKNVIAALLISKGNKECMVCERVFDRKNDVKRHLVEHLLNDAYQQKYKHKGLKCQICHDIFHRSDLYKLHMRNHGGLPVYQCALCGKTFSDSSNFTKHKKTHNVDSHSCGVCGKRFLAAASLKKHEEIHETSTPIKCTICGHVCYSENVLNKHMAYVHHKTTPSYTCVICKKKFKSLAELWDHRWVQHKERSSEVDCPLCGQSYRKFNDLRVHVREIHDIDMKMLKQILDFGKADPVRTATCSRCGMVCSSPTMLRAHNRAKHPRRRPAPKQTGHASKLTNPAPKQTDHAPSSNDHAPRTHTVALLRRGSKNKNSS